VPGGGHFADERERDASVGPDQYFLLQVLLLPYGDLQHVAGMQAVVGGKGWNWRIRREQLQRERQECGQKELARDARVHGAVRYRLAEIDAPA
jgi:hypothetical protein